MEDLAGGERERLLARYGRRFAAGQVIFREGEEAAELYLLQDGRVRLSKRVRTAERSVNVLHRGAVFGESALLRESRHATTAVAVSDVAAIALDRGALERELEQNHALAARVIQQLVTRVRDAEDQTAVMMLRDPQSRIVSALLTMAQRPPGPEDGAVLVHVSPLELATRVGADVETVKHGVQRLRESGYLRVSDETIEIPDVQPLQRLLALLGVKDEIERGNHAHPSSGRSGAGRV